MARIRIGVSGWNYRGWRGTFYPSDLPQRRELEYAASTFDTVEVNGTFYSLTSPKATRNWYASAPKTFLYAIKGSRFITHNKKLAGVEGPLANFLAAGVLDLADKLGPILWQLPANRRFDPDRLEGFLALLPRNLADAAALARSHDDRVKNPSFGPESKRRLRHVLEIRSDSFLNEELVEILRRHKVALAFSHSSVWPYIEEITAGFVYVRLHGPEKLYDSAYGEQGLGAWAKRILAWHEGSEPHDAVRITDRPPPVARGRDVYVYFDNDGHAHAPREAAALRRMVAD
jgi:uncharacterized protein YecE (DUF72 family)